MFSFLQAILSDIRNKSFLLLTAHPGLMLLPEKDLALLARMTCNLSKQKASD
nr:MAG TPA: hypothetical protein [Caudoviricetes sp.]